MAIELQFGVKEAHLQDLREKVASQFEEQGRWNDVFSTKLIELLDNIDKVKSEIRTRMRQIEETARAEKSLLESEARMSAIAGELSSAQKAFLELDDQASRHVREFTLAIERLNGARSLLSESAKSLALAEELTRTGQSQAEQAGKAYQEARKAYTESKKNSDISIEQLQIAQTRATTAVESFENAKKQAKHAEEQHLKAAQTADSTRAESTRVIRECSAKLNDAEARHASASETYASTKAFMATMMRQNVYALCLSALLIVWAIWSARDSRLALVIASLGSGLILVIAIAQLRRISSNAK